VATAPLASFIGAAVGAALMIGGLRRLGVRPTFSLSWERSRSLFEPAPHLVGFTLLGLVLFNFDLIFLRFVAGESAAGYYAAAYTFIAFAANLIVAWSQSVIPSLARLSDAAGERNAVYDSAIVLGLTVALPATAGGILTAPLLVPLVFGPDFAPAVPALQWLLPAVSLAAIREIGVAALLSSPRGERQLVRVNAWCVACNVALVIAIVPRYGLVGAAIATVATEVLRLGLALYFARQRGFAGPALWRYRKPAAAVLLMILGLELIDLEGLMLRIVAGAALYAFGLVITGALRLDGARRLRLAV
jgi:O-antigen/teichoic acid export membrane protein